MSSSRQRWWRPLRSSSNLILSLVAIGLILVGGGRGSADSGTAGATGVESASARTAAWVAAPTTLEGAPGWGRFRGPNGQGVSDTTGLPIEFGPHQNVVWKTPLPGGHSSPIVFDDRIFLTGAEDDKLLTLCLDRQTGEILWRRQVTRGWVESVDPRNNSASPSPAVDDSNVYVFFPEFGMIAYDHSGNQLWTLALGPFNNLYGMGASPIVVDGLVLLVCDQNLGSFLIAVGADDGKVRWRAERPEAKSGHSTPILYEPVDGPKQLIVPGSFLLTAYAVTTGERIWWVRGLSFEIKSVPVLYQEMVFINGYGGPINQPGNQVSMPPFHEVLPQYDADADGRLSAAEMPPSRASNWFYLVDLDADEYLVEEEWEYLRAALETTNGMLAIKVGGRGDMTEANLRWQYHRAVPQLPSPLIYNDVLYMVNDGGIVTSFDPTTGEVIAQGRLKGAVDDYYASPVAADGKIFMVSELGKVAVLEPDGGLEPVVVNDLDDLCYATPAIADGRIYVRTRGALYCFGRPQGDTDDGH